MQTLYADFGRQIGKIKEVNGVKMIPLRSVAGGLGYTVTCR